MTSSTVDTQNVRALTLAVTADVLTVELADGRTISAPLSWYPRLCHGTAEEREDWRLIGGGRGIHWPLLDEDISIDNLVYGKPSAESQASLKRWLNDRTGNTAGVPTRRQN